MQLTPRPRSPRVSVVMPVRDGARFITAAVGSILAQTMDDLELLVVDDGSTDDSVARVQAFADPRVTVLQGQRLGEGAARNLGLDHARGRWVAWQDADDVALPQRLEVLLSALADGGDFAHSDMLFIDETDAATGYLRASAMPPRNVLPFLLREGTPYNNPTMLIRRAAVTDLRFDESLVIGVDTDFVRRVTRDLRGVHVPEPLTLYRRHAGSISLGTGPEAHWPHVQRIVEDEPLEQLVPEAYREYSSTDAPSVAQAFVAHHLIRRGFTAGGVQWFERSMATAPGQDGAQLVAALVALAQQDTAAALQSLAPARTTGMVLCLQADVAARAGQVALASELYAQALTVDVESYDAVAGLRATGELLGLRVVDDPRRRLLGVGEH
jgi:hypothetical protein